MTRMRNQSNQLFYAEDEQVQAYLSNGCRLAPEPETVQDPKKKVTTSIETVKKTD